MKYLFCLSLMSLVCICTSSFGQSWKEIKRTDADKQSIAYKDTTYIYSLTKDSVSMRINGFQYNNKVTKDRFSFTFTQYEIVSNKEDEIVLRKPGLSYHYFAKQTASSGPTIKVPVDEVGARIKNRDKTPIKLDATFLKKNWKAYKRENINGPTAQLDFKTLVKRIILKDANEEQLGFMKLGNESGYLYRVIKVENGCFIVQDPSGKEYKFHIYELTERSLVFEDHKGVVYHCNKE